ncbi:MAG: abortive infection system antitoxin AbiGi family protein [bacterium]
MFTTEKVINSKDQWPKTLWHFVDKENKDCANTQFKTLQNIFDDKSLDSKNCYRGIKLLLSNDDYWNPNNLQITARYACLTSLPDETKDYHVNEYGYLAIGLNKDKLVKHCFDKNYILNPIFYTLIHNNPNLSTIDKIHKLQDSVVSSLNNEQGHSKDLKRLIWNNILLTKLIKHEGDYKYFLEQEWRIVDELPEDRQCEEFLPNNKTTAFFCFIPYECLAGIYIQPSNKEKLEELLTRIETEKNIKFDVEIKYFTTK